MEATMRGPEKGPRDSKSPLANGQQESGHNQTYNHKELNSVNNLNMAYELILSPGLQVRLQPMQHCDFNLLRL